MSLDPQAQAFLDLVKQSNQLPYHQLGAVKAREAYAQRPDSLAPPWLDLFRVVDQMVTSPDYNIPLRIYTPFQSVEPLPVLVFYHGGGMVIGTLDGYDNLCRQLATQAQCIVVSVDYRLAPEHKFPAAVEDAYAALAWVVNNTDCFGGDPHRIALAGDSAGGNLAAVMTIMARDQQLVTLKCQVLIYPATAPFADSDSQRRLATGYCLERPTILWFHECYLRSDSDRTDYRYAPLIAKDHRHLPPALVIVAGYDPLRDEGIAYAEQLKRCGVAVELEEYPGMFHPFVSLAGVLDEGKRAIAQAARTLVHYFSE